MQGVMSADWPTDGLEVLGACPVCEGTSRHILYDGLTDDAFKCAPGKWALWRCDTCTNAYLDPRPNLDSIGMAYSTYYTHADNGGRDDYQRFGRLRKLRRLISNSYTNQRYGTSYQPANSWVGWLLHLLPSFRQALDVPHRWLPKPAAGDRLLDVGCGNGAFLALASEAGWEAHGVDPDPQAIRHANMHERNVRLGGIEAYADMAGTFRAITLSHSIEHVHDPVKVLRMAYELLRPGGFLYVDTPNIDSRGRARFGRHWRGIETPRHLVIFSLPGLQSVLAQTGFCVETVFRRTSVVPGMFWASHLISVGHAPYDEPTNTVRLKARMRAALSALTPSSRLEFITLVARRIEK